METISLAKQTRRRSQPVRSSTHPLNPASHPIASLRRHRVIPSSQPRTSAGVATLRLGEMLFHLVGEERLGALCYLRVYDSLALGAVAVMTELDRETGWQLTYGAAGTIRGIAEKHHLDLDSTIWLDHSVERTGRQAGSAAGPRVGEEHSFIQIMVKPGGQLYWQYTPTDQVTWALGEGVLNVKSFMSPTSEVA